MWLEGAVVLLVLVVGAKVGAKVCSVALAVFLAGITQCGLLRNIRVGNNATLSIEAVTFQVRCWKNMWAFVRAPATATLFTITIPTVRLVVLLSDAAHPAAASLQQQRAAVNAWLAYLANTRYSLHDIRHPMWHQAQLWLHRLHFLLLFVHLASFQLERVDVVVRSKGSTDDVVRIENGNARFATNFNSKVGELECKLSVSNERATIVGLPFVGVQLTVGQTDLVVCIPCSADSTDDRAPLPFSVTFGCDSINVDLALRKLFASAGREAAVVNDCLSAAAQSTCESKVQVSALMLMRIIDAFRGDISFRINRVDASVSDPDVPNTATLRIEKLGLHVFDPSLRTLVFKKESRVSQLERKAALEVAGMKLYSSDPGDDPEPGMVPVVGWEYINNEISLKMTRDSVDPAQSSSAWNSSTCIVRMLGECKGLSVGLTHDLRRWVSAIEAGISALPQPATTKRVDAAVHDSDQFQFIDINFEVQTQFKFVQAEVVVHALDKQCVLLDGATPSTRLSIEELNILANPVIGSESLGIRSLADIQGSRLRLSYFTKKSLSKTCFLSLDFVRVFVSPVSMLHMSHTTAEIDLEAEWLEIKWSPDAMHAIGGLMELGLYLSSPFVVQVMKTQAKPNWDKNAKQKIPAMHRMDQVLKDELGPNEGLKFRGTIKKTLALFDYTIDGISHVEYLTVDLFGFSVEETTGRFRVKVEETKVFQATQESRAPVGFYGQQRLRRRASAALRHASKDSSPACAAASSLSDTSHYFSVKSFALEELKIENCPKTVVDIFASDVWCEWTIEGQLRIMELVRRITLASWEMLFLMRGAYAKYCLDQDNIYNRVGGVNPDMHNLAECLRCEDMLQYLISSSGDKLHRLHATGIYFHAKISDDLDLSIRVGLFSGKDMPDLWEFGDMCVSFGEIQDFLVIDHLNIRHTINKRRDYLFGEFEEKLRLRRLACNRLSPEAKHRQDGMFVELEGLRLRLHVAQPLLLDVKTIAEKFSPYAEKLERLQSTYWQPQSEAFFQYFLRAPASPDQMKLWLDIVGIEFDGTDYAFEGWLERVYPMWMEELEEQELRAQVLEDQVTTLKLTNADMLCDDSYQEMKALLTEKNAKIYVQKAKKLAARYLQANGVGINRSSLVKLRIGHVSADVAFEDDRSKCASFIASHDEATDAIHSALERLFGNDRSQYTPRYSFMVMPRIQATVEDITLRMRNFSSPIFVCESITVTGELAAIAPSAGSFTGGVDMSANVKCFVNLDVAVASPVVFFCPAYLYTLYEIAKLLEDVLPLLLPPIDRFYGTAPWDIVRRILHGRVKVRVDNVAARLFSSASSFEVSDYVEAAVQRVVMDYKHGSVNVDLARLTLRVEPGSLSNVAEFSDISVQIVMKWLRNGNENVHYVYPVEYEHVNESKKATRVTVDLNAVTQTDTTRGNAHESSNNPLAPFAATGLSVFVNGKMSPDCASLQSRSEHGRSKKEMAARTAIILYTRQVEWLIAFGRVYRKIPRHPFPPKKPYLAASQAFKRTRRPLPVAAIDQVDPASSFTTKFINIFHGVTIENFEVTGLDLAIYQSEKMPTGLRACINERIRISGAILQSTHEIFVKKGDSPLPASTRRLSIPVQSMVWVVHNLCVEVEDIQVRLCTPISGSRGESLVSVSSTCLMVGGGSEPLPRLSEHSPVVVGPTDRYGSFSVNCVGPDPKAKLKKNILDHFAIPQHNPFCYRDSDSDVDESQVHVDVTPQPSSFFQEFRSQGYLIGLAATETRVIVTYQAVETLVNVGEHWFKVIVACVPELLRIPEETLKQDFDAESTSPSRLVANPGRFTSLAEDPRYQSIFLGHPKQQSVDMASGNAAQTSNSESTSLPRHPSLSAGHSVGPFLAVKFSDCQISIQDHVHQGSVLVASSSGILKNSVSADSSAECVDLSVDGAQVYTAPLNVDVKSRVLWLKSLSDGSYCPSSSGVLKQVVAPNATRLVVWIKRDLTVSNKIDLQIATVQVELDVSSKDIMQNLGGTLGSIIQTKMSEFCKPDYSKMLQGTTQGMTTARSIPQLYKLKQTLKWRLADLQWRQACRWNYHAAERSTLAYSAGEHGRNVPFEVETSPHFRRRCISSASQGSTISFSTSISTHIGFDQPSDEIQQAQQQYESVSDLLNAMVKEELKKRQPHPNVELDFDLQHASFRLSAAHAGIVQATAKDLHFSMKQFEDASGSCTLTLQHLSCANLCPGTAYPELLVPSASKSWGGDDMFLRVDAEIAPPVGGIMVVQHFEVNVHPLQVCITQEVIIQLVGFFAPASSSSSQGEIEQAARSQFLQPKLHNTGTGDNRVGTALKKAARVAGKAAHPLTHGFGLRHRDEHDDAKHGGAALEDPLRVNLRHMIAEDHDEDSPFPPNEVAGTAETDDVNEMKDRAKTNILFKRIRLGTIEVSLTYKNKKSSHSPHQALEDMRGFEVKIHALVYCDKTCSLMDLLLRVRRDVILDVLSQVGRNFTNIGNFMRDQFDISRWAPFEALAPLKSLATSTSSVAPVTPASPSSGATTDKPSRSPVHAASSAAQQQQAGQAKLFQLEMPETQSTTSLRKKSFHLIPSLRAAESTSPSAATAAVAVAAMALVAEDDGAVDDTAPANALSPEHKKKKTLATLFTKNRKPHPSPPAK